MAWPIRYSDRAAFQSRNPPWCRYLVGDLLVYAKSTPLSWHILYIRLARRDPSTSDGLLKGARPRGGRGARHLTSLTISAPLISEASHDQLDFEFILHSTCRVLTQIQYTLYCLLTFSEFNSYFCSLRS